LHHPQIDAVVIGPRRASHLDAAIAALDIRLAAEEVGRLAALFLQSSGPGATMIGTPQ
jgi:aryl-alcohol dehydrogenase-like predicted oxidoreductase